MQRRTIQGMLEGVVSEKNRATPRKNPLSPTLFNIYINNIPKTDRTHLALFADDIAIISESANKDLAKKNIQQHLDLITDYWHKWKLKINADKTQNIQFAKRRTDVSTRNIRIGGTEIEDEPKVKYLGVILNKANYFGKQPRNMK